MIAILIAAVVSLLTTFVSTPLVVGYFTRRRVGQAIREDGPQHHQTKAGTPTMGGIAIVAGVIAGYLAARVVGTRPTPAGLLVIGAFLTMALVGGLDDFIKLKFKRNLGLTKTAKLVGQASVALTFGFLGVHFASLPRSVTAVGMTIGPTLPLVLLIVWVFILLVGSSNAVNLTDGLDGLVAGSATLVFGAYTLIAFWQARNPDIYGIESASLIDVAIVAASACAACAGFLWHNAPPAKIFMGDTGSLALGSLLAALALVTRTQLLLALIGGLYVIETLSVVTQVASFRTRGKRIFRMAPLHHHLELGGWKEVTVIVRLWIASGLAVALGIGIFYADFLSRGGAG